MAFRKSSRRRSSARGNSRSFGGRGSGRRSSNGGQRRRSMRRSGTSRVELIIRSDSPLNQAAQLPLGMRPADPPKPKKPL